MSTMDAIKEFWDKRPCNIRHSKKELGTKEYFNEVEKKRYFVEPHIKSFVEFEKWQGKKVLEIGCGIGTDSICFARSGAELTVIELSKKSLDICKQRFKIFDLDAKFYEGNAENMDEFLPLGENYDLIYAFGVIHHTENPQNIIKQIKTRLKPSGELRIMLYAKYSFKLLDFMYKERQWDFSKADEIIQHFAEAQLGCPKALTYTFDEITELLKGLDIIEMKKDHIFKYSIPDYIKGEYVVEECFKNISEKDFQMMSKELGWHTLVKAKLETDSI